MLTAAFDAEKQAGALRGDTCAGDKDFWRAEKHEHPAWQLHGIHKL
jgi:hypothetical protein